MQTLLARSTSLHNSYVDTLQKNEHKIIHGRAWRWNLLGLESFVKCPGLSNETVLILKAVEISCTYNNKRNSGTFTVDDDSFRFHLRYSLFDVPILVCIDMQVY